MDSSARYLSLEAPIHPNCAAKQGVKRNRSRVDGESDCRKQTRDAQ